MMMSRGNAVMAFPFIISAPDGVEITFMPLPFYPQGKGS
jgi:hypothetical protein